MVKGLLINTSPWDRTKTLFGRGKVVRVIEIGDDDGKNLSMNNGRYVGSAEEKEKIYFRRTTTYVRIGYGADTW